MTLTSITTHPTGRDYFRVSHDDSGRQRSTAEQAGDNRSQWAGELTFNGESYAEDNAVSASRFSGRNRGGFERLMSDLRTGSFGADVLVLWEPSRGSRKVGEWCSLIDLCEEVGVRIAVTTHGRIYDPANHRDRRTLQEDAVDAEYESGKTSDRVLRAMTANAAAGVPHGRIPFGYVRRYDPETRRLVAQEPHPAEAPLVAELFGRLRAGHSLRSVARDWEARGVTNRSGRPFSPQHLRSMALSETYGGYRTHKGTTTAGTWPALVDEATYHHVHRMLVERKMGSPSPGRARHLLTGTAVCDVCSAPLAVTKPTGKDPSYTCHRGRCVRIDKAGLDRLAERVIVAYLARHADALTADDNADADLKAARADVARIGAELDALYADAEAGNVSPTIATRSEAGIVARLEAARAREAELSTPSRLRGLIEPGADVAKRWKAAPIEAKREIARIVCAPDLLGELRVGRATTRGAIEDRVTWRR